MTEPGNQDKPPRPKKPAIGSRRRHPRDGCERAVRLPGSGTPTPLRRHARPAYKPTTATRVRHPVRGQRAGRRRVPETSSDTRGSGPRGGNEPPWRQGPAGDRRAGRFRGPRGPRVQGIPAWWYSPRRSSPRVRVGADAPRGDSHGRRPGRSTPEGRGHPAGRSTAIDPGRRADSAAPIGARSGTSQAARHSSARAARSSTGHVARLSIARTVRRSTAQVARRSIAPVAHPSTARPRHPVPRAADLVALAPRSGDHARPSRDRGRDRDQSAGTVAGRAARPGGFGAPVRDRRPIPPPSGLPRRGGGARRGTPTGRGSVRCPGGRRCVCLSCPSAARHSNVWSSTRRACGSRSSRSRAER